MKKRIVAILLCIALVSSVFIGCSKQSGKDSSTGKDNAGEVAGGNTTSEEWSWPLEEKKELSFWIVWENQYLDNPNELKGVQQIEENTNVHINWNIVSSSEAAEKFSLMIASGDYPDIIRGADEFYTSGLTKMVDDGVSIDLTDYIDKYMPNYSSLRKNNEKLMKDTMSDDGKIVSLYSIASKTGEVKGERVWGGPSIRKDWLDETGLDIPVTIDDWYEALTGIKAKHPECEAPLMLGSAATNYYGAFTSAFGVLPEFYQDNGVVKYGPAEEGYKQWVETFRQWYGEGLIDPNFVSNDASFMTSGEFIGAGKAAAGPNVWGMTADVYRQMGYNNDENYWLSAAPYPVLNEGDDPQAGAPMSELVKETLVVTTACEDVELALRYLDYYYTTESMMLSSLGIEGETYVDNGDGTYSITDALLEKVADGTYPTVSEAVYTHSIGAASFGLYNWEMYDAIYEGDKATDAYDVWENTKYDLVLPPTITMTDEEAREYASLYSNILTLVQENTVNFIMGGTSMDEYDSFVERLHTYGIDRCIELKQAALDRYNARSN
ncbi:MAG TPA: extracellular solute-binding protein [Clostridiales bacterium]|nr:extracellular solute-binding protein [Clostridiales bacterium]